MSNKDELEKAIQAHRAKQAIEAEAARQFAISERERVTRLQQLKKTELQAILEEAKQAKTNLQDYLKTEEGQMTIKLLQVASEQIILGIHTEVGVGTGGYEYPEVTVYVLDGEGFGSYTGLSYSRRSESMDMQSILGDSRNKRTKVSIDTVAYAIAAGDPKRADAISELTMAEESFGGYWNKREAIDLGINLRQTYLSGLYSWGVVPYTRQQVKTLINRAPQEN